MVGLFSKVTEATLDLCPDMFDTRVFSVVSENNQPTMRLLEALAHWSSSSVLILLSLLESHPKQQMLKLTLTMDRGALILDWL